MQNTDEYYLVRTAWLYGGKGNGKRSFVDLMLSLAGDDKIIDAVTDEFGQPTYTFDLAQALVALTEENRQFGTYHITNSGMASWYDWAKEIFSIRDIKAKLAQVNSMDLKRAARRPKYGVLNNTKFIELRPWTEALKEYLTESSK
jgi:dTDP-4-dehydrorhamnose reductase